MKRQIVFTLVLVLVVIVGTGVALAAESSYDLSWWTVDGGGGTSSSGGSYSLSGSIGQPDAGPLSNSSYTLQGGFWVGGDAASPVQHLVYLPLVRR